MFVHAIVQFLKRIWVTSQDSSNSDAGYWSFVPTQVSENDPLPVDIPRIGSLIDESSGRSRLLVQASNDVSNPLFVKQSSIDTLLFSSIIVDSVANRDLLNNSSTELPTLDRCGQYRKLIWFARRESNTVINYTILARATDLAGMPLGGGWQTLLSGTFAADPVNPNWVRLDIPATGDGYYDQYRIEVSVASGTVALTSKIVGVR